METNVKFFFVAVFLSIIGGLPGIVYKWWTYFGPAPREAFNFFLQLAQYAANLVVTVIIPFGVMYMLGKVSPKQGFAQ